MARMKVTAPTAQPLKQMYVARNEMNADAGGSTGFLDCCCINKDIHASVNK